MPTLFSQFFNSQQVLGSFSPKPVTRIQDIQNIAFILGVEKLEQSHLNLSFLQAQKIIENEWTVKPSSRKSSQVIQLDFNTGVTLIGLPNSLIFREKITDNNINQLKTPPIIERYINYFPQRIYRTFTVNFQRIFNLPNQQEFLHNYIKTHLLDNSLFEKNPPPLCQVDIQGKYQLKRCQMTFKTKVGNLEHSASQKIPFLLFFAGFHYSVYNFYSQERLEKIRQCLEYLNQDYQVFQELVEHRFLG